MNAAWPPPEIGVTFIRTCRAHFHVAYSHLDAGGDVTMFDISQGLTLAHATERLQSVSSESPKAGT